MRWLNLSDKLAQVIPATTIRTVDGGKTWVSDEGKPAFLLGGFVIIGSKFRGRLELPEPGVTSVDIAENSGSYPDEIRDYSAWSLIEKKKVVKARLKALSVLLSHLDKDQSHQYIETNSFKAIGKSGNVYEISLNDGKVKLIVDSKPVVKYCIHADMPIEDNALAHKLFLESDDKAYLSNANKNPVELKSGQKFYAVIDGQRVDLADNPKVWFKPSPGNSPIAVTVVNGIVAPIAGCYDE